MSAPSRKFFLVACEASGDLHASELIRELKKNQPSLEFRGLGGPKMAAAGMSLIEDMTRISALGFGDVLRQYFKYRRIFYAALEEIKKDKPDVLILIDSPAFNLRLAKKARSLFADLNIFYYICPQIWAWGHRRIHNVRKNITKMYSILPFEASFYAQWGVDCEYVGNPLIDEASKSSDDRLPLRKKMGIPEEIQAIGLLPGSRQSEVGRILPVMLCTALEIQKELPKTEFFLAPSPNIPAMVYEKILSKFSVKIQKFETPFYEAVKAMDFALVTSGTATLQTALANTPFCLLYKTSWSTYLLGKQLIRVPCLGIVNLLAGKTVAPEFIQWDANPKTIAQTAKNFLLNPELCENMRCEFGKIRAQLGEQGASQRAAQSMMAFLNRRNAPMEIPV